MSCNISRRNFTALAGLLAATPALLGCLTAMADEADYGVTGAQSLSAADYNMDGEYAFSDFNAHSQNDASRQGCDTYTDTDVVFQIVSFDELIQILNSEGNYLIEFGGGSWCHNTRAFSAVANEVAKKYGVKTIYTYDFDFDNAETGWTFIRMTNGTEYGVGVNWNYMYGEIVSTYLTNLNDWVQLGIETDYAITYTNAAGEDVTVPRLQEPFLMLYNKDNEVNNSQNADRKGACPVVYAFEKMVDRDSEGIYLVQKDAEGKETGREYITEEFTETMSELFDYIAAEKLELAEFVEANYLADTYQLSNAGALDLINYAQLTWLLGQDGSALILFANAQDEASREIIGTCQEAASEAGLKVYVFDPILDNGVTTEMGYTNSPNIYTDELIGYMFTDLVDNYMTNGADITVGTLFAYNPAAADEDGFPAPVFATATSYEQVADVIAAYKATI